LEYHISRFYNVTLHILMNYSKIRVIKFYMHMMLVCHVQNHLVFEFWSSYLFFKKNKTEHVLGTGSFSTTMLGPLNMEILNRAQVTENSSLL
jgi:hypothetical protein